MGAGGAPLAFHTNSSPHKQPAGSRSDFGGSCAMGISPSSLMLQQGKRHPLSSHTEWGMQGNIKRQEQEGKLYKR